METTRPCLPATGRSKRSSSLPNKIKIRTCKLPKDFFQTPHSLMLKAKSGCESRGSTCDEDTPHPCTPSFRQHREFSELSHLARKAETAWVIPAQTPTSKGLARERGQSIRRKLSKEVSQRFPILLLPPISTSSRVFMGF